MNPSIVQMDQLLLVGFGFYGDPFAESGDWTSENEIGRLWKRFIAFLTRHGERIRHIKTTSVQYELHIYHDETATNGHYEVFAGLEVERLAELPVELSAKLLPATLYAVFTFKGAEITSDWARRIYQEWMPGSGYEPAHSYMFELYDERFKGMDRIDESEIDVYIPVKLRNATEQG